jgi:5-methylcytosine-specific restriction endonuclease McrA
MRAKGNALCRGISWDINEIEYEEIIKIGSCFYCGGLLPEAGSALDRVDSKLGYMLKNLVPCCTSCNHIKTDSSLEQLEMIVERLKEAIKILRK